jgi:hypothetical protein
MIFISTIQALIGLIYTYFWLFILYSWIDKRWFLKTRRSISLKKPLEYKLLFLVTTKGGNPEVIERGIKEIVISYPDGIVEVVTESIQDKIYLENKFGNLVNIFIVPADYNTPQKTKFKARALHYMVEQHKKIFNKNEQRKIYVVHYDEESVIKSYNILPLLYEVNKNPKDILAGPIFYPLDYKSASFFSRVMEANRGFVEPECAFGMISQKPKQGHGSNLIVNMEKENIIGWDIGTDEGNPYIAEDLFFLVSASAYGFSFGWHGVEMIEQPAFKVKDSVKQRDRWVTGTLQTIKNLHHLEGWNKLSWFDKITFKYGLLFRTLTYSIGFIASIVTTFIWILYLGLIVSERTQPDYIFTWQTIFFVMWIGAYQYGAYMNLRHSDLSFGERVLEHILIFILSPIAGIIETWSSFKALVRWYIFRKREQEWTPTPKLISTK